MWDSCREDGIQLFTKYNLIKLSMRVELFCKLTFANYLQSWYHAHTCTCMLFSLMINAILLMI